MGELQPERLLSPPDPSTPAVTVAETRALLAAPRSAEARLEMIPGAGHAFGARHPMRRPAPALERAIALSETWLQRTLHGERTATG